MEDFDIAPGKIGDSGQRLADRAVEEARRREHAVVGNEHLLVAFAQSEWDLFAQVMRDFDLNPRGSVCGERVRPRAHGVRIGGRPAQVIGEEAKARGRARDVRRWKRPTCLRHSSRTARVCRPP